MRPRFQADANFNGYVISGLIRKDPRIDLRTSHDMGLEGVPDDKVLQLAAADDRILLTHDVKTMPLHFGRFTAAHDSAGVLIIPQALSVGHAIESILLVWFASKHEEYKNRIVFLPF
ncbi:MAG: DUF5615 family PIN-like protein [Pyrinomonadaceae bacterium]